jgi:hypothetical protein
MAARNGFTASNVVQVFGVRAELFGGTMVAARFNNIALGTEDADGAIES